MNLAALRALEKAATPAPWMRVPWMYLPGGSLVLSVANDRLMVVQRNLAPFQIDLAEAACVQYQALAAWQGAIRDGQEVEALHEAFGHALVETTKATERFVAAILALDPSEDAEPALRNGGGH
jgi:hypothetical protein